MKKFYLFFIIALSGLIVIGCSQTEDLVQTKSLDYLDFDVDSYNDTHQSYFKIAVERMDKYVTYENGQFTLSLDQPDKVGLSPRVFDFMKNLMYTQNETIKEQELFEVSSNVLMSVKNKYPIVTTRSDLEGGVKGGINAWKMEWHWYGIFHNIYISANLLLQSTLVTSCVAGLTVLAPDPTQATRVVAALCSLSSATSAYFAAMYPNGMIIKCYSPPPAGVCIPYNIFSQ